MRKTAIYKVIIIDNDLTSLSESQETHTMQVATTFTKNRILSV